VGFTWKCDESKAKQSNLLSLPCDRQLLPESSASLSGNPRLTRLGQADSEPEPEALSSFRAPCVRVTVTVPTGCAATATGSQSHGGSGATTLVTTSTNVTVTEAVTMTSPTRPHLLEVRNGHPGGLRVSRKRQLSESVQLDRPRADSSPGPRRSTDLTLDDSSLAGSKRLRARAGTDVTVIDFESDSNLKGTFCQPENFKMP
jgi:hypothetical protein